MAYHGPSTNESNLTSGNGTMFPDSAVILTSCSSVFSIVGASVIFFTHYFVSDLRRYDSRILLIFLTIADFFTAFGNLLGAMHYYTFMRGRTIDYEAESHCEYSDGLCVVQSFITTFSSMSSFFWTLVIAFHLFAIVKWQLRGSVKVFAIYHVLCWGLPGIITITAVSMGVLGDNYWEGTGPWCWIKACMDKTTRMIWMLLSGKFWEFWTYLVSAVLFIFLYVDLRRAGMPSGGRVPSGLREGDKRFTLVWLFLYLLRVWGTLRFLLALITDDNSVGIADLYKTDSILFYFQCVGDSAQAGINCILFCLLDKTVRREFYRRCCQRSDENQSLLHTGADIQAG